MAQHPLGPHLPSKNLVVTTANGNGDGNVPALKPRNFFLGFLALKDQFDEQVKKFEELNRLWQEERRLHVFLQRESVDVEYARNLWEGAQDGARQCLEALKRQWSMIQDLDIIHPSIAYLMLRIAEMVGKFPEGRLSDQAAVDYATGLAERLQGEDMTVMSVEDAFREIEDTKQKPPAIADMLPLIKKHKKKWQQRMDAINVGNIQRMGEATVFALEYKNAVFREALTEYLDAHGDADIAAGVRAGNFSKSDVHFIAIHSTARSEGMAELIDDLEAAHPRIELFRMARRFEKHVRAEWDLRELNAQQRLNRGKSFACKKCGAGYGDDVACKICDEGDVVGIDFWDEHAAGERQPLVDELEEHRHELEERRLRLQREQWCRKKLECQKHREHFVKVRSERIHIRRMRRIKYIDERIEERGWAEEAKQQEIEQLLLTNLERAQEEHWAAIAEEYDPLADADAETIKAFRRARPLTDEEFAELKKKARRELAELKEKARIELIERTRRVIEEQRDEAMRDLEARLAEIEGWKNDGTIGEDYSEVIDDLKSRVADLESRGGGID